MNQLNVLIITHEMHGNIWYKGAFEKLGCNTSYIITTSYATKKNYLIRLKRYLGLSIDSFLNQKEEELLAEVEERCRDFKPQIIVVLHGIHFKKENIEYLKKKYFVVMYMSDKLALYPQIAQLAPSYHLVYTYAKDDYEKLLSLGVKCKYFPTIGTPGIYYNTSLTRDIDISFIGSLYPANQYGDRYAILKSLVNDFPSLNIQIYGKCAPFRKPRLYFEWLLHSNYRRKFMNKTITEMNCNEIYNRSKICLCIEPMTGNGWSSRLANMILTKSFVITTNNEMVQELLSGCVETFSDYEELRYKVQYYLNNCIERERIANYGFDNYFQIVKEFQPLDRQEDVLNEYCLFAKSKENKDE